MGESVLEPRSDSQDTVFAAPRGVRTDPPFRQLRVRTSRPHWHRIVPTALVMALAGGTLGALSAAGYCIGQDIDSDLRFLEPRRVPTYDEAALSYPVEYALRTNEKNDVIFLGDSTCRCCVDPGSFERLSGLRAYNLGSQGRAGPAGFLITAKAYVLRHPPPQVIVLCMTPVAFENGAAEIAAKLDSTLQARFEANYGPEVPGMIPRGESLRYFIKRGSLAAWSEVSAWLKGREQDVRDVPMFGPGSETFRSLQRRVHESRGYCPLAGLHGKRIGLEWPGEPVKIHAEWDRNVRLLAETCESLRIPLLIRFSPMPGDLSRVKDFAPIEEWSRDLHRSYPHLFVGHPSLLWYDWKLCYDNLHLNSPGVEIYMAQLAKDVQDVLGTANADGWK